MNQPGIRIPITNGSIFVPLYTLAGAAIALAFMAGIVGGVVYLMNARKRQGTEEAAD